jgi:hypothetical protein
MTTLSLEGGCACGAVRYAVAGQPFHASLCHCIDCRRALGASPVAWFSVRPGEFRLLRGRMQEHRSSPPVLRGFCAECGTSLTFRAETSPDEIDIATATLDDPRSTPPGLHLWTSQALPWALAEDGLPRCPRGRDQG